MGTVLLLHFRTVAGNALASRLSSGSSKFDNRGQTPEEKNIFPQYFFCPVERCFPATAFRSRHTSAGGGHAVCQLLAEAVLVLVAATLENVGVTASASLHLQCMRRLLVPPGAVRPPPIAGQAVRRTPKRTISLHAQRTIPLHAQRTIPLHEPSRDLVSGHVH